MPEEREDHAVAISRFASQCIHKFNVIVKELEVHLGPGTEELALRVGLNSGPVTAGVLRGDKGRFQLFGDTVNTAASKLIEKPLHSEIDLLRLSAPTNVVFCVYS